MSIQEVDRSDVYEGEPIEPMLVRGVAYEFSTRFGDGNLAKAFLALRHMGAGVIDAGRFTGEEAPHAFFRHPEVAQESLDNLFMHLQDTLPEHFNNGEQVELTYLSHIANAAYATGLEAQLNSIRS